MAKTAPYPPCTGIDSWLKYLDSARMLRQVTLTEPYRRAVTVNMGHTAYDKVIQKS